MRVLSFGAGVQSTAVLVAAHLGLIEPIDLVIFADTGAEPKSVYDWLAWVQYSLKCEIEIVRAGNIVDDSFSEDRFASPPLFVRNLEGNKGMLRRQCTVEYKINPIHKFLRQFKGQPIDLLMGISTDECQRAKASRVKWMSHKFPLLWADLASYGGVLGWNRQQCFEYVTKELKRSPPKSACYFCPFHTDDEWRRIKTDEPETFAAAVEYDEGIRKLKRIDGQAYLHRSLKPLIEVDFDVKDDGQMSMLDECEGMCGV